MTFIPDLNPAPAPSLTPSLTPPSDPLPVAASASAPVQDMSGDVPSQIPTHRSMAARILGAVSDVLGGKDTISYSRDPSGALGTTPSPNSRGTQVRNIIGNALQGAAAGAAQQGPNANGRAFAAGLQGEMQQASAQDQAKRTQADQDFETKQRKILQDAQLANYTNHYLLERRTLEDAEANHVDELLKTQNETALKLKDLGAQDMAIIVDGTAALAAPGEIGSAAAKIPSAAENMLHISEQALEHLAENYPHLSKLADKLGYARISRSSKESVAVNFYPGPSAWSTLN